MWNTYNPMVDAVRNYGGIDEQDIESPYFEWDELLENRYEEEDEDDIDEDWIS